MTDNLLRADIRIEEHVDPASNKRRVIWELIVNRTSFRGKSETFTTDMGRRDEVDKVASFVGKCLVGSLAGPL